MQQVYEEKNKGKMEIGRLCVKIAGRDADRECVVVEVVDKNYVIIDGNTRRRKCNITHLEPLDKVFKIKKSASHKDIIDVFKKEGIKIIKKGLSKQKKEKFSKDRVVEEKEVKKKEEKKIKEKKQKKIEKK